MSKHYELTKIYQKWCEDKGYSQLSADEQMLILVDKLNHIEKNIQWLRLWQYKWDNTEPDPRDSDPRREGIFQDHNCYVCDSGRKPCVKGHPRECDTLRARND